MKEYIKNQIGDEIFSEISHLENTKNKSKQNKIAKEIISRLDIEDFTPYMAYDQEGDILIGLNYCYSSYGVDESLMTGKHDVVITGDGIYIDDETSLESSRLEYLDIAKFQSEQLLGEDIKTALEQKEYDEISKDLEFYGHLLTELVSFERPKSVGNFLKITEIDAKIKKIENIISDLEFRLDQGGS